MKTHLAVEADPQSDIAAAELAAHIEALFAACPNLCGFVVQDLGELRGDMDPHDGKNGFAITQVSFDTPFSRDESHQVCNLIVSVCSELVTAQPETYELLRDRTFLGCCTTVSATRLHSGAAPRAAPTKRWRGDPLRRYAIRYFRRKEGEDKIEQLYSMILGAPAATASPMRWLSPSSGAFCILASLPSVRDWFSRMAYI
jgi:hypothetical protein